MSLRSFLNPSLSALTCKQVADMGRQILSFLDPDAFLIEDSRVDKFFGIDQLNLPQKYTTLLDRFRRIGGSSTDP